MTLPNGEPLRWDMGSEYTWDGNVPASAYPSPTPSMPTQQNDIDITITAEKEAIIMTKADELRAAILEWAIMLDDETRNRYFKLGDERLPFDEKCDDYMHQRADLQAPTVNLAAYDKDGAAIEAVKRIRAKVATIDRPLQDTQIVLGADRLDADLAFYNYLEFLAVRTGNADAAEVRADLKSVYPGRGRSTPPPAAGPTP